jgi:hypothetical protein
MKPKHNLVLGLVLVINLLTISCSHSGPLLSQETPRGKIQYTIHSPETEARQHIILAHGFLRTPDTMEHIAESLAKEEIETVCIKPVLRESSSFIQSRQASKP